MHGISRTTVLLVALLGTGLARGTEAEVKPDGKAANRTQTPAFSPSERTDHLDMDRMNKALLEAARRKLQFPNVLPAEIVTRPSRDKSAA
jgi:hypothetical protein